MITVTDWSVPGVPESHRNLLLHDTVWERPPYLLEGELLSVDVHWDETLGAAYLKLAIQAVPTGVTRVELQLTQGLSYQEAAVSPWCKHWMNKLGSRARWSIVHARVGHMNTQFLHGYEWLPSPDVSFDPVSFLEALRS